MNQKEQKAVEGMTKKDVLHRLKAKGTITRSHKVVGTYLMGGEDPRWVEYREPIMSLLIRLHGLGYTEPVLRLKKGSMNGGSPRLKWKRNTEVIVAYGVPNVPQANRKKVKPC